MVNKMFCDLILIVTCLVTNMRQKFYFGYNGPKTSDITQIN